MTGSTSTGPSGSSFSYSECVTDSGNVTESGLVTSLSESTASSATYRVSVTGPPDSTTYQESV